VTIQDLISTARSTGAWRDVISAIPYFGFLGIDVVNDRGPLEARLTFSDHLVGNPTLPALHGGVMGALLEAAAQFELLYRAESSVLPKTITLTIDYLRSAKAVETRARAEVLKHGRRVATVLVRAYQDDPANPVAIATVHLLVRAD
jgi:uncharacterized protein (TIGR00369 family)